jgi:cytoskeletal protein CcmA (bactofilin family)
MTTPRVQRAAQTMMLKQKLDKLLARRRRRRLLDSAPVFENTVGSGALITASLSGSGHWLVHGRVIGDGDFDGIVVLAAGARWEGGLRAHSVIVHGELVGDVVARGKVELGPTGQVTGAVTAPLLAIAEGGRQTGEVRMGQASIIRFRERRGAASQIAA